MHNPKKKLAKGKTLTEFQAWLVGNQHKYMEQISIPSADRVRPDLKARKLAHTQTKGLLCPYIKRIKYERAKEQFKALKANGDLF